MKRVLIVVCALVTISALALAAPSKKPTGSNPSKRIAANCTPLHSSFAATKAAIVCLQNRIAALETANPKTFAQKD